MAMSFILQATVLYGLQVVLVRSIAVRLFRADVSWSSATFIPIVGAFFGLCGACVVSMLLGAGAIGFEVTASIGSSGVSLGVTGLSQLATWTCALALAAALLSDLYFRQGLLLAALTIGASVAAMVAISVVV